MKPASNELKPTEAKIQAGIRFNEELRVATSDHAPELMSEALVGASADFFRTATGGDFGVHNRTESVERAQSVQYSAVRYVAKVRQARLAAS
jgi:hypothetical protein